MAVALASIPFALAAAWGNRARWNSFWVIVLFACAIAVALLVWKRLGNWQIAAARVTARPELQQRWSDLLKATTASILVAEDASLEQWQSILTAHRAVPPADASLENVLRAAHHKAGVTYAALEKALLAEHLLAPEAYSSSDYQLLAQLMTGKIITAPLTSTLSQPIRHEMPLQQLLRGGQLLPLGVQ
jgi:hypothetical protein